MYNKVGAVTGYPGPDTGVAAAAGNPGPEIVMKGGRSPSPGPNYQSFKDGSDWPTRGYAPVKTCNNNQCGGRRRRRRTMRKAKRSMRKGRRSMRKARRTMRRSMRKAKRTLRKKTRRHRRRHMRGGSPATVPSGSNSSGYHQYMSNQPFSNSYSAGGHLSPSENALANPVLIHPTDNCAPMK